MDKDVKIPTEEDELEDVVAQPLHEAVVESVPKVWLKDQEQDFQLDDNKGIVEMLEIVFKMV